ncbi:hypothetical protein D0C27_11005 [Alcaligenes faecalis]|uniref:hypothetical protein n=1 Tax=Alcaligenes faecalis TaxID=511 RepID=UPI0010CA4B19|nr:hypothetical protein [Alcaligenes faecalis]QCP82379.1 hypothetical protein D0C27_11005 [Alcaligenes faecalis]
MTPLEAAVIAMVEAKDVVDGFSRQIGKAISESLSVQYRPYGPEPKDWLKLAYERDYESDGCYGRQYYYVNHDDDIEGYLAGNCEHALKAHQLIQERKEARKALAIARRRVSAMGRNLIKARSANAT